MQNTKIQYYTFYKDNGKPDFWANVRYRAERKFGDRLAKLRVI